MAGYRMHLAKKQFALIKEGTKRLEVRLNDEKRQQIGLGDRIDFDCEDASIATRVTGVLYYANFKDLLADFPMEMLASKETTEEEFLKDLEKFYTPGLQAKYGVVGFRFELI